MILAEMRLPPAGGLASRILALALLALLLLLIWIGLVAPVIALLAGQDPISAATQQRDQQQLIVGRQSDLQARKDALLQSGPDLTEFLSGASASLASAELQSRIALLVKPLGGVITSVEPLSFPDEENFHRAGLRVKITLRPEMLPNLLYDLEKGKPLLIIANAAFKANEEGGLGVTLELFGYLPQAAP